MHPFLKWAGGKRKIVPDLVDRIGNINGKYHEPFLGSGALFLNLAFNKLFNNARIADSNLRLIKTWKTVKQQPAELIDLLYIYQEKHNADFYYELRSWNIDSKTDLEVAAWFIYLNKTAYNGLYRVNSKNAFNVPIGRYDLPKICPEKAILEASSLLTNVEIEHSSFTSVGEYAKSGDLVYFDPPYVPLSKTASFTSYTEQGFGPEHQIELRDLALDLIKKGIRVVLSNHDTPLIRELYVDFKIESIKVRRMINSKGSKRGPVNEVIITG